MADEFVHISGVPLVADFDIKEGLEIVYVETTRFALFVQSKELYYKLPLVFSSVFMVTVFSITGRRVAVGFIEPFGVENIGVYEPE